jgi:hypothetical protein
VPGYLVEHRKAALITLDGDDALGTLFKQCPGETAGTGTNLEDGEAFKRACCAGDLAGQVEIEQEILTQRLPRREPVGGDNVAQWRQAVMG